MTVRHPLENPSPRLNPEGVQRPLQRRKPTPRAGFSPGVSKGRFAPPMQGDERGRRKARHFQPQGTVSEAVNTPHG